MLFYPFISHCPDNLESPELPVFCTPGLKIKKTNVHCSPPTQGNGDHKPSTSNQPTTPEVPVFQTPYVNRMVSTKKVQSMCARGTFT